MRFSFAPKNPNDTSITQLVRRIGLIKLLAAGAIVIVALVVLVSIVSNDDQIGAESNTPLVQIAAIRTLSAENSGLSTVGRVRSVTEATIQTEAQGQITRVNYELGDSVSAGAVIAEISNASERASVSQTRAALAELESQSARSRTTTYSEAVNAYRSAFITADDAIQNKTEPFFLNDRSQFPNLIIPISSGDDLEEDRAAITILLREWERDLEDFSTNDDVLPFLGKARIDLIFIESFLNELASAANRRTNDASGFAITDADRASLLTGRSNVSAELGSLITIENSLRQTLPGSAPGGTGELEAQIAAAEARVATALAALEKTIVRAPISGTINALDLERGNFVSLNTPVVTIANNNALEVETFVTASDKSRVSVGNNVTIDGRYQGIVTNVAPGLDPVTNRIKVEIGVEDDSGALTNGDTVRLNIERTADSASEDDPLREIIIPITALKVETDRIVVFTVSGRSTLVAHPITEGPLVGRGIIIEEGVTPDLQIVLDARGLNEGDLVEVAQ